MGLGGDHFLDFGSKGLSVVPWVARIFTASVGFAPPLAQADLIDIGTHEFGIRDYDLRPFVDLTDFAYWSYCMTGPGATSIPPGCEPFDFNANSAIDLLDFAEWQHVFMAP